MVAPRRSVGQRPHDCGTMYPDLRSDDRRVLRSSGHGRRTGKHQRDRHAGHRASRWSIAQRERGQTIGILETNHDATERRRAEDALPAARRPIWQRRKDSA